MKKNRAFLKWAGGKYTLMDEIRRHLPQGECLIEPFVGAGSVFLNTDYDKYLLSDINSDLINLYKIVQNSLDQFLQDASYLFTEAFNNETAYYQLRDTFNQTTDPEQRAILFLYLNRHCYNGLCRYNSKGEFNVPFGRYKRPYFPEKELLFFSEKAKNATFVCGHYETVLKKAAQGSVVYCDPPYAPLTATANFTAYHSSSFDINDQKKLAKLAQKVSKKGIPVLISNHNTIMTKKWYKNAELYFIDVRRTISSNKSNRTKVNELFALYR